jgi:hypothetical protein
MTEKNGVMQNAGLKRKKETRQDEEHETQTEREEQEEGRT